MPLLNGTINYTLADLNIVAMYLDGSEIDTLPDGNYELTEESYCTNEENVKDEAITLSYDSSTKGLSVSPMTKKGTKCYLYFEEKAAADIILASSNAPTGQTTDWTGETTYYYTGNPNNWVSFAGFYWRIIRINGDGSIRMIYQGVADSEKPDDSNITGTGTQIGESEFNNSYRSEQYIGFTYGNSNSTILGTDDSSDTNTLNGWYRDNLLEKYTSYVDGNAGFCNDRTISRTYTKYIYYGAYGRLVDSNNPSLSCEILDIYTTEDSSMGNKALTYPIGLISADEARLAGIPKWNSSNSNNYLYTGQTYWTMSPAVYDEYDPDVFTVWEDGSLDSWQVYSAYGVRPVINLKSTVALEGDGSVNTPFKIVGT